MFQSDKPFAFSDGNVSTIRGTTGCSLCVLCDSGTRDPFCLCAACRADLPHNEPVCYRCGLGLKQPGLCGQCQRKPPPFDSVRAPFLYRAPVDYLIQELKYRGKLHHALVLGGLMAEYIGRFPSFRSIEYVVPVPLHLTRLQERGFNQALEIARPLCRRLGLPLMPNLCRRTRATHSQSLLPAKERQLNVSGVFHVDYLLSGQHIAIVDDVMTTGSTVIALASALIHAGAAKVDIWVVARASFVD